MIETERKKGRQTYASPKEHLAVAVLEPLRPRGPVIPAAAIHPLARLARPRHRDPFRAPALARRIVRRVDRVRVDVLPVLDVRLGHAPAVKVVVDVVEPLAVRRTPLAGRLDRLLAEAAPEAQLKVAAHAAVGELLVEDGVAVDAVVFFEVGLERFAAVADLAAFWLVRPVGCLLGTAPDLELEVLAVFVPLPVVLAAELLVALGEGAGVGFCVAL